MKNYAVMTVLAQLPTPNNLSPGQAIPVLISMPNNATPLQIEYRQGMGNIPSFCAVHYLIPCDENGNPIEEEFVPVNVFKEAWEELYKVFGEQMQQEEIDLMDSVLNGVTLKLQDEREAQQESEEG